MNPQGLSRLLSFLDYLEGVQTKYRLVRSGTEAIQVQVQWPGGRLQASFSPDRFEYRLFEGNEAVFADDVGIGRLLDLYDPGSDAARLATFRALADRFCRQPDEYSFSSCRDIGGMVAFVDRLDAKGVQYLITREGPDLLEVGFTLFEYRIEVAFTEDEMLFSFFRTDGQVFTDEAAMRSLVVEGRS